VVKNKKKNINCKFGGHFAHKCKTSEGIYKMSCWLTEEFDGGGKLINVVQFQEGNWSFVNVRGNWRNLQFQGVKLTIYSLVDIYILENIIS